MGKWGLAALVAGGLSLFGLGREARADDAPLGLSIALERVAGVSYGSARIDAVNGGSFGATAFTLAGAAIDPIFLPRAAGDVILPSGLTLGGALGYSHAALTSTPDGGGASGTLNGEAWILSPRVGYRIHLSPLFDLWPRAGITFARAGFTDAEAGRCAAGRQRWPGHRRCTTCMGSADNTYSLFYTLLSLDAAVALRVTQSFNILGGIAYDQVVAASGSETRGRPDGRTTEGGRPDPRRVALVRDRRVRALRLSAQNAYLTPVSSSEVSQSFFAA